MYLGQKHLRPTLMLISSSVVIVHRIPLLRKFAMAKEGEGRHQDPNPRSLSARPERGRDSQATLIDHHYHREPSLLLRGIGRSGHQPVRQSVAPEDDRRGYTFLPQGLHTLRGQKPAARRLHVRGDTHGAGMAGKWTLKSEWREPSVTWPMSTH